MGLNTTPRTWVAGEISTAANFNAEVRDAFTGIQSAWTAYTPTWTASTTNPSLGNGVIRGAYYQVGKTIMFSIVVTVGSTTSVGSGTYSFSLPLTSVAFLNVQGTGVVNNNAGALYGRIVAPISTSVVALVDTASTRISNTVPVTLTSGMQIAINGTYESA